MVNIPTIPSGYYKPIWIDTTYTFIGSSAFTYYITDSDNNKLFSGKAYAYPGTSSATVNINHICENYLSSELKILDSEDVSGTTIHGTAFKTFKLFNSSNTLLDTFMFYWNYNQKEVIYSGVTSIPINGHYALDMKKLQTTIDENGITTSWNSSSEEGLGYSISACGDYVLYYLNRNGGWDSFLIEGKVQEKDNYSISSYEGKGNQVNYWSRETNRFRNQINHTWELHTDWLTDEQSTILAYHLLSSNVVYLHDLVNGDIIAVNITDTSTEYKKFTNERKLISYTINLKESNNQVIL